MGQIRGVVVGDDAGVDAYGAEQPFGATKSNAARGGGGGRRSGCGRTRWGGDVSRRSVRGVIWGYQDPRAAEALDIWRRHGDGSVPAYEDRARIDRWPVRRMMSLSLQPAASAV